MPSRKWPSSVKPAIVSTMVSDASRSATRHFARETRVSIFRPVTNSETSTATSARVSIQAASATGSITSQPRPSGPTATPAPR